jgi:ABC-type amino acid transport substrate-binding protein
MEGKRIYVTTASPSILRLENIQHEIGANFEIIETPYTQCDILLEQLSNGAIDYIACDYETAEEKVKQYPNLDIKTIISFSQFKAWAVNRDSTQLLNKLNDFLQKEISK